MEYELMENGQVPESYTFRMVKHSKCVGWEEMIGWLMDLDRTAEQWAVPYRGIRWTLTLNDGLGETS